MLITKSYTTEFLAESNLLFAQEDYGNKLYDLLYPVKNFVNNQEEILGYSLARYCGANSRLAFYCEWMHRTFQLTLNSNILFDENESYWNKKTNNKITKESDINNLIREHIKYTYVPLQIGFLHDKFRELTIEQTNKYPYFQKYLGDNFLSKFTASEVFYIKRYLFEDITLPQYLEVQSLRSGYLQICMPCILGFLYLFNQEDNPINPKGVKWHVFEEILKQIAVLYQINLDHDIEKFNYYSLLRGPEKLDWLKLPEIEKEGKAIDNPVVMEISDSIKEKIYNKTMEDINNFIFPENHKEFLANLLDWAFKKVLDS